MGISQFMQSEPVAWPTSGIVSGLPQSGLVALWDAGLSASHPGSGTTWSNLVADSDPLTWNPNDKTAVGTVLSNGNATLTLSASTKAARAFKPKLSGGWVVEFTINALVSGTSSFAVGLTRASEALPPAYLGATTSAFGYQANGICWYNGVNQGAAAAYSATKVVSIAWQAGKIWTAVDGVWSGDPAAGTGQRISSLTGTVYPTCAVATSSGSDVVTINATPVYALPSGFSYWSGSDPTVYDLITSGLTFAGTAGRRSAAECLTSAGSGYGALSANTTFTNSLHKDNAAFTLFVLAYVVGSAAAQNIAGSAYAGGQYGVELYLDSAEKLTFYALNSTTSLAVTADSALAANAYHFIGLSVNEAGSGFLYADGVYLPVGASNTWTAAYTGPTGTNATAPFELGRATSGSNALVSGTRLPLAGLYNRALTKDELDQAFNALRGRYGI